MLRAEYVVQTVKAAYSVLREEEDLSPRNPRINNALDRLVKTLSESYTPEEEKRVLLDRGVQEIRGAMLGKLSQAESAMELFWSEKFCEKPVITQKDMQDFWYWQNYSDLVGGEVAHLPNRRYDPDESICFVGSGPLPLTAFCLTQMTGKPVTCVDCDETACNAAEIFIHKAGLEKSIKIVHSDGDDYNYKKHPAVLVASLVPNKEDIMARIQESRKDACVGLRSAERLHTLLYDPVDETTPGVSCCTQMGRTAHDPKIINTTLFMMIPPEFSLEREKHIKGKMRDKFGWRNPGLSIFPPA